MRTSLIRAGRATRHLAVALLTALGTYLYVCVVLIGVIGALTLVGAVLLPEVVLLTRRVAGAKRKQTADWTGHPVPEAYHPVTGTVRERVTSVVRDPTTWRDLRWMVLHYLYAWLIVPALLLWPAGLVVDGLRVGVLRRRAVVLPLVVRLADLEAGWSASLLRPPPRALLSARVRQLAATRADAVAAHGAELRRIERDLHDGTQARLVSLSMRLGLALRALDRSPETVRPLLRDAQEQTEQALAELRHVVRGIHPPILTDRGLTGAVRALASGSGLDVEVDVDGLEDNDARPPAAVESAAYFAIAEALTNAAKYARADRARVSLERLEGGLRATVRDEGVGGADEKTGSGLLGIRRRVAALDGTVEVSSPAGGPTEIVVELPCVW